VDICKLISLMGLFYILEFYVFVGIISQLVLLFCKKRKFLFQIRQQMNIIAIKFFFIIF